MICTFIGISSRTQGKCILLLHSKANSLSVLLKGWGHKIYIAAVKLNTNENFMLTFCKCGLLLEKWVYYIIMPSFETSKREI